MHPVEDYLTRIQSIYATGAATEETSYYGALEALFNKVGYSLKPKVHCVPQPASQGSGHPDFGLYADAQMQQTKDGQAPLQQLPERGAVEVKSWKEDTLITAQATQVSKYWQLYRLVLITNFRDFVVIGSDAMGKPLRLDSFRLADNPAAFIQCLNKPRETAQRVGERLLDFLRRAFQQAAPLAYPAHLAWFLASYAREAKARVEAAENLTGLVILREGLEQALGLSFQGRQGNYFFRATLVQTLFYGVFSAWVLWARKNPTGYFDWRTAVWYLRVPMIKNLFEQIATPSRLQPLGLDKLLDWTGVALNRVDRSEFFRHFEEEHAVQYFYEPFLEAYDPVLRKALGVWYTPPEIVKYQVARVDRVLREELGLAEGLADPAVVVLDPCCGTGAYLVETLRHIHATLKEQGGDALTAAQLKQAALTRIFGFELLPAPFVVAHLQIGLLLQHLGTPLGTDERAGVYLTNALTGWEPPDEPKKQLPFPEFQEERDRAEHVKQHEAVLVVIGNPPYNAFAGVSPEEEGGLVEIYKHKLNKPVKDGGWGIKKFNLDDLYVRFFRVAERRILKTGKGVVSYISNYSWVSEPSFVVLRQHLLHSFDKFWIENLHGNRKISEYAPDGRTSETIFAIPGFSVGIQQGVVTSLWVKTGKPKLMEQPAAVLFRDDIDTARAVERRQQLLESLEQPHLDGLYQRAKPVKINRFSFRPSDVADDYQEWPEVNALCAEPPSNGLMEKRGGALMDYERDALQRRMEAYFDEKTDWNSYRSLEYGLEKERSGISPEKVRKKALSEGYSKTNVVRYAIRPFDVIWAYYSSTPGVWNRARPNYREQCWKGNEFFMTRFRSTASPEGIPCYWVRGLSDDHFITPDNACFPIRLLYQPTASKPKKDTMDMFNSETEPVIIANLSKSARAYLQHLKLPNPDQDADTAALIWLHALAIGYSPAYLSDHADGIRQDWPRIPLPSERDVLQASAALGRRVATVLDTETPVQGVTQGGIRPDLKPIAVITRVGGGTLDPDAGELALTAGWGHRGQDGKTMPGKGRLEPRQSSDPNAEPAYDVYLNSSAYWANIPKPAWEYTIGGYQVIKKWLSYREKALLGRDMRIEEVQYVTQMARRLAALVRLQPDLDANYQRVKADIYPWEPGTL